jgi:hypothetical protein
MPHSIFVTLCDILDEFDAYVRELPLGPDADRLGALVHRLDAVIDRTIGLEQADVPADE